MEHSTRESRSHKTTSDTFAAREKVGGVEEGGEWTREGASSLCASLADECAMRLTTTTDPAAVREAIKRRSREPQGVHKDRAADLAMCYREASLFSSSVYYATTSLT